MSASNPDEHAAPKLAESLTPLKILESISDSVCVYDRDWRFTYLNQRAIDGISGGRNLLGKNLWESFPELEQTKLAPALRTAMAEGKIVEAEDFYEPLNEWVSISVFPLPDGIAVFFRSITERKRHEAARIVSELRFRSLFETLPQGVMFQDDRGFVTDLNPAGERILGAPRSMIVGLSVREPILQLCDQNGVPFSDSNYPAQIALTTAQPVSGVVGFVKPLTQERRWLHADIIPQYGIGDAAPRQLCVVFTDFTEQKSIETALRDNRAQFELARRMASVGSGSFDFATATWTWSDDTYQIFGVDKQTFYPTLGAVLALIHPEDRSAYVAGLETARNGVVPYPLEYRIVRPDTEIRILYREMDLIRDETGQSRAISTMRDITDVHTLEREKEALRNQLYHAQRLDTLGTLAGGIVHDLNNTLVPILGLSESMLRNIGPGDPNHVLLETIHESGTRARNLVRQILTFSRRENPDNRVLDLLPFLQETMRLVRATVPETVAIEQKFSDVPLVFGDANQLHQVILNLFTNAAHAIGNTTGTIVIEVATDSRTIPGNTAATQNQSVRISISDSGCGMDEETQKRIFEPFFTTKKVGVGTGLGLAVVHAIVTAHGGHIAVQSRLGHGTRFDILLPAYAAKQDPADQIGTIE